MYLLIIRHINIKSVPQSCYRKLQIPVSSTFSRIVPQSCVWLTSIYRSVSRPCVLLENPVSQILCVCIHFYTAENFIEKTLLNIIPMQGCTKSGILNFRKKIRRYLPGITVFSRVDWVYYIGPMLDCIVLTSSAKQIRAVCELTCFTCHLFPPNWHFRARIIEESSYFP